MSAPSPRVLPVGCGYRLTLIKPNPGLRYFPLATLRCAPSDAAARLQGPHVVRPGGTQLVPVGAVVRERSGRTRRQPTQYTNPPPEPMVVATCWEEPSVSGNHRLGQPYSA